MVKINVYLTDNQHREIIEKAEEFGISFSEMLRRVLDQKDKTKEKCSKHPQ